MNDWDIEGAIAARYHYDEFGSVLQNEKFDLNYPGPDNLFGYTGLAYDYTSGLNHARARYFDASIGRFISEDTYLGEYNNPLIYTDPSGHIKDSFGATLRMPKNSDEAADLIAMAKANWEHGQNQINLIKSGKGVTATCKDCNKIETWLKYQESMHAWANKIRATQSIRISAFIKAEVGSAVFIGGKIGIEVKDDKIKFYFINSAGSELGTGVKVTGGVSLTNDISGNMSTNTAI